VNAQQSARPDHADALAIAATRKLRDLASGPLGGLITHSFRVMPQQHRSMESVERMLVAVERLVRRSRSIDALTLDAVALEAHVTPQAAYRYFHDVGDVIRLFARRVQTVEHELLMSALTEQRFETEVELADTAVSFVIEAYRRMFAVPLRMRDQIARDYTEICYELVWTLSGIVCSTMSRREDPCAGIGAVPLNSALVSVISVAVSFCLRDDHLISSSSSHAMMLNIFLAAIGRAEADCGTLP